MRYLTLGSCIAALILLAPIAGCTDDPGDEIDDPSSPDPGGGDSGGGDSGGGDSGGGDSGGGDSGGGDSGGGDSGGGDSGGGDSGGGDSPPLGAYCDPVSDWPGEVRGLEAEVLKLVNEVRSEGADCGSEGEFGPAEPLTADNALDCAARLHSLDMYERDYFKHENPDGESPWDRMEQAGYAWRAAGENIAAGATTAEGTMDQWMNSDGHCANIMSKDFIHIGIGHHADGRLWTQVFGTPK